MNALIGFLLGLMTGAVLVWTAVHLIVNRERRRGPRLPTDKVEGNFLSGLE